MNLEEHVIKKEGKMKIMSSSPSVFVDTRQSCHVIDPSLEIGLSHWPSRALSLSSLSLLPLPFLLRLTCSLQISVAVSAWRRGWPRRRGTRVRAAAARGARGGAGPSFSRRRGSRAGCGGERCTPLPLPAARLAAGAAGWAPPPGGEARGQAAAARGARGGAGPSFSRRQGTRAAEEPRYPYYDSPRPALPANKDHQRRPSLPSGAAADQEAPAPLVQRRRPGPRRRWWGPRARRWRRLLQAATAGTTTAAATAPPSGDAGQWCRWRRHTRLFFYSFKICLPSATNHTANSLACAR